MSALIDETRFEGEPGLRLEAGELEATFLPHVGMTGVSLRYRDHEFLSVPGGVDGLRAAGTAGLPLLAPWANRLSSWQYRAEGLTVDLAEVPVPTDYNGLPIHGLVLGTAGWQVTRTGTRSDRAMVSASLPVDTPAFPFPHRIDLDVTAHDGRLEVRTTVEPTGGRRVPVSFGWHPYFRLADTPRDQWVLRLPARGHVALDDLSIPTDAVDDEGAEAERIGERTFDDLYRLLDDRRLALESETGSAVEVVCDDGYDFAQVWVPAGRAYAALEPMVAPTNALIDGNAPVVDPGDSYGASFTIELRAP